MRDGLYRPEAWYWRIADENVLYSSARDSDIAEDDAEFLAWGRPPTRIKSRKELYEVLDLAGVRKRNVRKITIVRRLQNLGRLHAYDAAMKIPANLYFARAWEAAGDIKPDDPDVVAFFDSFAATPEERDALLAREERT